MHEVWVREEVGEELSTVLIIQFLIIFSSMDIQLLALIQ
jgi:hypothetical protein